MCGILKLPKEDLCMPPPPDIVFLLTICLDDVTVPGWLRD